MTSSRCRRVGDPGCAVLEPDGVHPLLSAVGRAFAEDRLLVLPPDAAWLTIAQGIAQHVRLPAEELRPRLVSHAGRKRLPVRWDGTVADWRRIRQRMDAPPGFGLESRHRSRGPNVEHFVRAADGDVDRAFRQRIDNPVDAYGGDRITGWATPVLPLPGR